MIPEAAPLDMPPEVDAQQQRLAAVQAQLEQHPYINWGMRLPSSNAEPEAYNCKQK